MSRFSSKRGISWYILVTMGPNGSSRRGFMVAPSLEGQTHLPIFYAPCWTSQPRNLRNTAGEAKGERQVGGRFSSSSKWKLLVLLVALEGSLRHMQIDPKSSGSFFVQKEHHVSLGFLLGIAPRPSLRHAPSLKVTGVPGPRRERRKRSESKIGSGAEWVPLGGNSWREAMLLISKNLYSLINQVRRTRQDLLQGEVLQVLPALFIP